MTFEQWFENLRNRTNRIYSLHARWLEADGGTFRKVGADTFSLNGVEYDFSGKWEVPGPVDRWAAFLYLSYRKQAANKGWEVSEFVDVFHGDDEDE